MAETSKKKETEEEIAERTAPPGHVVYEAIYEEGRHELGRGTMALTLSGLAAGLSMGFSLVAEGLLHRHLPEARWTPLITKLGYSIGFLIVILGRQQLFTKNTLTVILPLLRRWRFSDLLNVARLWAAVFISNLAGAFLLAWFIAGTAVFNAEQREAFTAVATAAVAPDFFTLLLRGILAGWLIALMVWLLPFAETARVWVIIIVAYLVGLAELPHVVAGTVEAFYLVACGALPWARCFGGYIFPTLLGNVIGGVAIVALGAHAEFIAAAPTHEDQETER